MVEFRIGKPLIQTCTDGENIFLQIDLMLGVADEEESADIAWNGRLLDSFSLWLFCLLQMLDHGAYQIKIWSMATNLQ